MDFVHRIFYRNNVTNGHYVSKFTGNRLKQILNLYVTFSMCAPLLGALSPGQKCQSSKKVDLSFVNRKLSESTNFH